MRQFFLVLSGMVLMNINSHKIPFISKLFWAHLISPTSWAELVKIKDEINEKQLLYFFKGLTTGLVSICLIGTIIGYYLYNILPTYLVSIPVFIMPLYITILMLRAVELFYRVAVISGGLIGPVLFPYTGDWSIIIAGISGGTIGLCVNYFVEKRNKNA